MSDQAISAMVTKYRLHRKAFSGFMNNVIDFFQRDNENLLDENGKFVVHSVKSREKDPEHLEEKIRRKLALGKNITEENLFDEITDFCGVRVIHLRMSQFHQINKAITDHVQNQHWCLKEDPKAYTWDPEYKKYFENCGVATDLKESFYTSAHYVVKPNPETSVTCEIQVRSLFEEIWGEIDHDLNYPQPCENIACTEQLKVLAKLVGAGTRLIESIYASSSNEAVR